ncbi:MAG: Ig domain-containing protein [Lachnotalea sp.]
MKKFNIIVMSVVISFLYSTSICNASHGESAVNNVVVDSSQTEEMQATDSEQATETQATDVDQTADTPTTVEATEIDLGDYQTEMLVGDKQLLTVTVLPTDTTDQTVTYQSSNENVATVNGMGRITAVSAGTAQITATCGGVQNSFQLTVKKTNDVEVTDIEIGDYESEMEVGKTQTLSAAVLPSNATNTAITYKSSNTTIATVLSTGEVKAIAKGVVSITVSAGAITKQVEITVNEVTVVTAEEIDLGDYEETMVIGDKQLVSATVLPTDTENQTLTYQSSDEKVASINEMGRITAVSVGKAKITVRCGEVKNSFKLEVKKTNDIAVTDVEIGDYEDEMEVDKT